METVKASIRFLKHGDIAQHRLPYPIVVSLQNGGGQAFYLQLKQEIETHFHHDSLFMLLLNTMEITLYFNGNQRQITLRKPPHLTVEKWITKEVFSKIQQRVQQP